MPFSISYNGPLRVVEAAFLGRIHFGDLRASGQEASRLSKAHGVHDFLCDAFEAELDSSIELIDFTKAYAEADLGKGNQMAVVLSKQFKESRDGLEIENIAWQWGFRVRRFETRQAATDWLINQRSSL